MPFRAMEERKKAWFTAAQGARKQSEARPRPPGLILIVVLLMLRKHVMSIDGVTSLWDADKSLPHNHCCDFKRSCVSGPSRISH